MESDTLYTERIQEQRFEKLNQKYKDKSFFYRNKGWFILTVTLSYFLNLYSIGSGCSFLYFSLNNFMNVFLTITATLFFMVIIEVVKRKSSSHVFENYFKSKSIQYPTLLLLVAVILLSVTGSFLGTNLFVRNNTDIYENIPIENHEEAAALMSEISIIKDEIKAARNTKWKGTTTVDGQRSIKNLSPILASKMARLDVLRQSNTELNTTATTSHNNNTNKSALIFSFITLLTEIGFLLSIRYASYYEYRSWLEETLMRKKKGKVPPKVSDTFIKMPIPLKDTPEISGGPTHDTSMQLNIFKQGK